MSVLQIVYPNNPVIKTTYSHDAAANLLRGVTSIITVRLSCLWWASIWWAASSRIVNHSIALPQLSTPAPPNNHYLLHLGSAPRELQTEHHLRNQSSTASSGVQHSPSPPSPEHCASFRLLTPGLEEQQGNIDWRWWCSHCESSAIQTVPTRKESSPQWHRLLCVPVHKR